MEKEIISNSPRTGNPKRGGDRYAEEQGALLYDRPNPSLSEGGTIRYFSMFSGVGGFELGLQSTDNGRNSANGERTFECIGFSEIDKYSIQTYLKHFPSHRNFGDATKIVPEQLPDFDMLVGGFPCQSFSIAGKRKGFDDTRGTMFFEIARIVKIKRPRILLLENVKGLLNHDKGQTFTTIIQTLEELGYDVQWMVLNSKFFGVPQNRERVFIIGSLGGERRPEILPFRESYSRDDEQNCSSTITSSYKKGCNNHNQLIGERTMIRRLTPIECERLQGFPDNWTEGVSDTQRYKQMGNAVTVNVIRAIGERL